MENFKFFLRFCAVTLLHIFICSSVMAQQAVVTGTVSDREGPLPGVNVSVKGSSIGTSTDANGRFQITAPGAESVLMFSFIGYFTIEKVVGSQRVMDIEMIEDVHLMSEVVVTALGIKPVCRY